jgi:hypothetical protein
MNTHDAFKGDWIEVSAIGGGVSRRGQIVEVLGGPGHRHYRVRWDEQHESLHFPADGTRFLHEAPDGALVEPKELG